MKFAAFLTVAALVAGCSDAYAQSAKSILAGGNGLTLYTFDKDTKGTSNCYGGCAKNWPPFIAKSGAKAKLQGMTKISRTDGSLQWAKDGKPLYFWIGDTAPGETNGDGVGGVWHVARR